MSEIVVKSEPIRKAKIEEFKSGVRPDGNLIGTYRSPEYALTKVRQNPAAGGRVDLILTGDFTKKLFVQNPSPSKFTFNSTDEKAPGLFSKYGKDLKGLNQKTFNDTFRINHRMDYIMKLKQISGIK